MDKLIQRDAALGYAAMGLPVFPACRAARSRPSRAASTPQPPTRRRSGVCGGRPIATSASRPALISGFWVLDIDGDDGEANLRALEARHGALPATREVISGGGGRHLWFAYTGPIPSTAGRIAPGIDVRCDGAYVVVPPSIHPSGRAYAWSVDAAARPGRRAGMADRARAAEAGALDLGAGDRCQRAVAVAIGTRPPMGRQHSGTRSRRSPPRPPAVATMRSTARPSRCFSSLPAVSSTATR